MLSILTALLLTFAAASPGANEVDLLRSYPGAPRVFVQAEFSDGQRGVFMVDTGASISVVSASLAAQLDLEAERTQAVTGLSGTATVATSHLPPFFLGETLVSGIEVAIDVPGVPQEVGFMPLDGLLGNNVWRHFTLELDYPADVMVLHPKGTVNRPKGATDAPLVDGHVDARIDVQRKRGAPPLPLVVQLDTGASDLTVCATTGARLAGPGTTQGVETLRGVGASETLPPFHFLHRTRRLPFHALRVGRTRVPAYLPIRWIDFDQVDTATCALQNSGLLGHEYLANHRMLLHFDPFEGWLSLEKSQRKPRQNNGHEILYDQTLAQHGATTANALTRGKLLLGMARIDEAMEALDVAANTANMADANEARVLAARVHRQRGEHTRAWETLRTLSAADLVDQRQLVATVIALIIDGRTPEAQALAEEAVDQRPDNGWSHVALSEVWLARGDLDKARDALLVAAQHENYPEAHLLRRARVALASGDRHAAISHIRELLHLYPAGGPYLWFYAMLLETPQEQEMYRSDLQAAMDRLHPFTLPYDFLVGAHRALDDPEQASKWLERGLEAHCDPMPAAPTRDNCVAWYFAMSGTKLDAALKHIDQALRDGGDSAAFLDTKAMVHLSRGEFDLAESAALAAARLSPDDVYMLWQAERIAEMAREFAGASDR